MFRTTAIFVMSTLLSFGAAATEGLIRIKSSYSVKETADNVESVVSRKGFRLLSRIDHQKNAESVNMMLRPTEVIIFGNPKVGTQLMQCAQTFAIDLPQKMLVLEDENGSVWVAYNDLEYLNKRHQIKGCDAVISKVSETLLAIASAAVE